jgi:mannan endo-1,4-beta-mannosidase
MKLYLVLFSFLLGLLGCESGVQPVNPDAGKEAKDLLNYIYTMKGDSILSGQHNYPGTLSESTEEVYEITGKYPMVWGQDFGFTPDGQDGIIYRERNMQEAIKKYREGYIITLMWHAVRPIDDEPNGWKESVQNDLTDDQWEELVTPGTPLHNRWLKQLDVVAGHLKVLCDNKVPVLWRPYHEMNGGWFWWGKKEGEKGYKLLWRNMYDYFTRHHKLNNLIWVWNANELRGENVTSYADYFPGPDVVDILATDVYTGNYDRRNYDLLLELAQTKPIAIGECGPLPSHEVLEEQPEWTWFMCWSRMIQRRNTTDEILNVYNDKKVLTLKD